MVSGYFVPQGNSIPEETVERLSALLPGNEVVRVAMRTTRFERTFTTIQHGFVMITSKAIYASKERLFGSPKLNVTVPLDGISAFSVGPLYGVGPDMVGRVQRPQSGLLLRVGRK